MVGDCMALWPRIRPLLESRVVAASFTPRLLAAMDGAAALVLHKAIFTRGDFTPRQIRRLDAATRAAMNTPKKRQ